ncbi:helix-turn-helix domain-containing protein [Candidatus Saccharibacteria bacterium]|nr:MAG: helix-turn-helix domain-containing protein [Candidatus Saccharibacteria bacterium]
MQDDTEAELITRSRDNDTEAFGVLVDRYKTALYHHCFTLVRNEDTAEDIAQETFIAAYYALSKFNPEKES